MKKGILMVNKKYIIVLLFLFFQAIFAQKPIYLISIPKCGTHLLIKLVEQLTQNKVFWVNPEINSSSEEPAKNIYCGHLLATPGNMEYLLDKDCKCIFIYRDPRDQVVSFAYHIKLDKNCPQGKLLVNDLITLLINDNNFLKIFGGFSSLFMDSIMTINDYYKLFLPWVNVETVYVTTFEQLVGSRGGGDDLTQRNEIIKIADYLSVALNIDQVEKIQQSLFGNTYTFRSGQIGAWKQHFNLYQKKLFKEVGGKLLIELDYEKNLNW